MMRRAVRASVRRSRAVRCVVVVQARFAETSAKEDRDDSSGGNSGGGKWWQDPSVAGAMAGSLLTTFVGGIASYKMGLWSKDDDADRKRKEEEEQTRRYLEMLLRSIPKLKFAPRADIKAVADKLLQYIKEFKLDGERNVFVVLVGPKGAGKTSAVEHAFGGKSGVIFLETTLNDSVADARNTFREALEARYRGVSSGNTSPSAEGLLERARIKCETNEKPLIIYWKIDLKGKKNFATLERIASDIASNARSKTYDHPERSIAVIIETSNPVLASLIPKKQSGCNEVIYVDSMNFDDFVKAAETDEETGRYIEKKLENGKVQQGLQTDDLKYYYSCFGGNLREMRKGIIRPLLEEYNETKDVEEFRKAFREDVARLSGILGNTYLDAESGFSDDEKELCELIARQGPGGLRPTPQQDRLIAKIRSRDESMDILREHRRTVRLHRMAHARCILARGEEETVSPKAMEECGWLPKTDKAGSA